MKQSIEKGKTLLVDGPACITLYSGKIMSYGAIINGGHVIIRRGRRIPFEAMEDSHVELLLGNTASCTVIDGSSIPDSWIESVEGILSVNKNRKVVVLGGIDSGKTSFCTYLANTALNRGRTVAIIDGDIGQSDIGPSGTLGLSIMKKNVVDLFNLQPDGMVFIGVTSPYNATEPVINGLVKLKNKALSLNSNFLIFNTDGWIDGADAVSYKVRLIEKLKPDVVVAIQDTDELKFITDALSEIGFQTLTVKVPKNAKKRDKEIRRAIRELSYKKYLKDAKVRSYPLGWIRIDGNLEIKGKNDQALRKKIEDLISKKVIYCENSQEGITIVLKDATTLSDEEKEKLDVELGKPTKIMHESEGNGLLVALEDSEGRFLGIGTICCMDFERNILKVYTPVEEAVSRIHIGQIRLNNKGNEVEVITKKP